MIIKNVFFRLALMILGAFLVILGGCAHTDPARFYVLHSLSSSETDKQVIATVHDVPIVIGPIELREHLDRPQIVTRVSSNELKISEFDQWAESLKNNISRVLAENISILLSTEDVFVYPWRRSELIEYQVVMEVIRFDGILGGNVVLDTHWAILTGDEGKMLLVKKSSYSRPTGGENYQALVAAKSQTLADFSRDIAQAISSITQEETRH
jgi:uncharacterized protein